MDYPDRKISNNEKHIPFVEKFMVPQLYDLFKFGGGTVKDDERGIKRMLQYFPDFFTEEQLRNNMQHYNLSRMFELVKRKRQIIMRSDAKLPQPFASWSNSL